jgi:hypothetical protein
MLQPPNMPHHILLPVLPSSRTPRSKRSYTPSVRLFNSGITANILAEGGSLVADIIRGRVPVTVVAVFVVAALLDSRHLGSVFPALGLAQRRSEGQAGEEGGENNGGLHNVNLWKEGL